MDAQINLMEQVPSVQSLLSVKRPVRKGPALAWIMVKYDLYRFQGAPWPVRSIGD